MPGQVPGMTVLTLTGQFPGPLASPTPKATDNEFANGTRHFSQYTTPLDRADSCFHERESPDPSGSTPRAPGLSTDVGSWFEHAGR